MEKQNRIRAYKGDPVNPGVSRKTAGINFAVEIPCGISASLVLYRKGAALPEVEIPFTEEHRTGRMCAILISGLKPDKYEYNFRAAGKIMQDPFARVIRGREKFGAPVSEDEHAVRCGFLSEKEYDWKEDTAPQIPYNEMILYKVHVRGYTKQAKLSPRKKGTFAGLVEMIPYWKEMGINAIELMPAYEFQECTRKETAGSMAVRSKKDDRINYWGYAQGFYFAPKASYCATKEPDREFRDMVHALHQAGIECIMEMYFPENTPSLQVVRSLWMWKLFYHVDGFHLQGDSLPVTAAAQDLLLSRTKLFYTHFDPILLENAKKYHHLYVYSDEYLYPARKMLNHMEGDLNEFFCQQRKQNSVEGFVNYITNNNGFTLWDLFSYCEKHNLENGEDNCDGNSFNYSSNCGVEGNTRKRYIDNLRKKQVRNALAMEFLAQGVPLVLGGDEFLNSQQGNNNAYCQDNKTGWLNWKKQKKETWLAEFIKNLADFRREHPIISSEHPMELNDYGRKGFPDLSYHGESAWISSIPADRQAAGILYCGEYEKKTDQTPDDYIYIGYNFHSGLSHLALPKLPQNKKWYLLMTTAAENSFLPEKEILEDQHLLAIEGQSINIVIGI